MSGLNTLVKAGGDQLADMDELDLLLMQELEEEGDAGFDLMASKLKMMAGGTLAFDLDGEVIKPPVTGIVLVAQGVRGWFARKNILSDMPLCSSPDGVRGHFDYDAPSEVLQAAMNYQSTHPALRVLDDENRPDAWDCASCPMRQYGSAKDSDGSACKPRRRMVVLLEGFATPILLSLPQMSMKAWNRYASTQKGQRRAYFGVWTDIGLEEAKSRDGVKYATATFSFNRICTPEEKRAVLEVRKQYEELIRTAGVTRDEYSEAGEVVDGVGTPF